MIFFAFMFDCVIEKRKSKVIFEFSENKKAKKKKIFSSLRKRNSSSKSEDNKKKSSSFEQVFLLIEFLFCLFVCFPILLIACLALVFLIFFNQRNFFLLFFVRERWKLYLFLVMLIHRIN